MMTTTAVNRISINPRMKWVDLAKAKATLTLPDPWLSLEANGGRIEYAPPQANITAMTQSVFTHLLAETVKLMECFLPFAYSITPEAREIKALL